ncbi:hypothetical protein Sjap_021769 [Stephania japonica]|uniref:Uncharacterized protein n=1 Tax=Stephania japonica TaxID=461633 RepID=A0AAP0ESW2_9MAGN
MNRFFFMKRFVYITSNDLFALLPSLHTFKHIYPYGSFTTSSHLSTHTHL